MAYFDCIKVGDKVWSARFGCGRALLRLASETRFNVQFECGATKIHELDGTIEGDYLQTLYWQKPDIIDKGKPLPDLKVDAKVIVWNDCEPQHKHKRHFKEFREGKIVCFDNGKTRFTSNGSAYDLMWDNYEIVEE